MRNAAGVVAVAVIFGSGALGVAQVPQPYRAWVIVWVLVGIPLTFAGLAIARQVVDLRRARLDAGERNDGRIGAAHPPAQPTPKPEGLRVVTQEGQVGSGRHIIR